MAKPREKSTGEKWLDFFIGDPKRTIWMFVLLLILVVMCSPDLQRAIATLVWGVTVKVAAPLALLIIGFSILWKKVLGGK